MLFGTDKGLRWNELIGVKSTVPLNHVDNFGGHYPRVEISYIKYRYLFGVWVTHTHSGLDLCKVNSLCFDAFHFRSWQGWKLNCIGLPHALRCQRDVGILIKVSS